MNYNLYKDSRLFRIGEINDNIKAYKEVIGFSGTEDYTIYKGLNRTEIKDSNDYGNYATIYIRANNKKTVIKKIYQDLFEFYADFSSLLLSIFWLLGILFAHYDRFKANHSISKRLFYFEGIKRSEFARLKKIKNLIEEKNNKRNDDDGVVVHIRDNSNQNTKSNHVILNNFLRRNTDSQLNNKKEEINVNKKELIDYSNFNLFEMIGSSGLFKCRTKKFESKLNLFRHAKCMIDYRLNIIFYIRNMILLELIKNIYLENKYIIDFLSKPIIYLKQEKKFENAENDSSDIDTTKSIEKIEEKPDLQMLQYLEEGELYKSEYKLSQDIEYLILNPDKNKNQKKLINLFKKHLKGI